MTKKIRITKHAKQRVKDRAGGKSEKLLADALQNGYSRSDFTGSFGRFLDKLMMTHESRPIIHKGKILFVKNGLLITLYDIPTKYRGYKPKGAKHGGQ